mgnify:CR=1 FL=1
MSKYAFGVDVGGTTVKLGLFNDEGQVLDKWEIPTVKDNGGEKVLPDIAASIKIKCRKEHHRSRPGRRGNRRSRCSKCRRLHGQRCR